MIDPPPIEVNVQVGHDVDATTTSSIPTINNSIVSEKRIEEDVSEGVEDISETGATDQLTPNADTIEDSLLLVQMQPQKETSAPSTVAQPCQEDDPTEIADSANAAIIVSLVDVTSEEGHLVKDTVGHVQGNGELVSPLATQESPYPELTENGDTNDITKADEYSVIVPGEVACKAVEDSLSSVSGDAIQTIVEPSFQKQFSVETTQPNTDGSQDVPTMNRKDSETNKKLEVVDKTLHAETIDKVVAKSVADATSKSDEATSITMLSSAPAQLRPPQIQDDEVDRIDDTKQGDIDEADPATMQQTPHGLDSTLVVTEMKYDKSTAVLEDNSSPQRSVDEGTSPIQNGETGNSSTEDTRCGDSSVKPGTSTSSEMKEHATETHPPQVVKYTDYKSKANQRKAELEALRQRHLTKPQTERLQEAEAPQEMETFLTQRRQLSYQEQRKNFQSTMDKYHSYRKHTKDDAVLEKTLELQKDKSNEQYSKRQRRISADAYASVHSTPPMYATMAEIDSFHRSQTVAKRRCDKERRKTFDSLHSYRSQGLDSPVRAKAVTGKSSDANLNASFSYEYTHGQRRQDLFGTPSTKRDILDNALGAEGEVVYDSTDFLEIQQALEERLQQALLVPLPPDEQDEYGEPLAVTSSVVATGTVSDLSINPSRQSHMSACQTASESPLKLSSIDALAAATYSDMQPETTYKEFRNLIPNRSPGATVERGAMRRHASSESEIVPTDIMLKSNEGLKNETNRDETRLPQAPSDDGELSPTELQQQLQPLPQTQRKKKTKSKGLTSYFPSTGMFGSRHYFSR